VSKEADPDNLSGIIEAAREIAEARAALLARLKSALLAGDDGEALQIAREYCGIEDESRIIGKGKGK
jgi:hypothetical protein